LWIQPGPTIRSGSTAFGRRDRMGLAASRPGRRKHFARRKGAFFRDFGPTIMSPQIQVPSAELGTPSPAWVANARPALSPLRCGPPRRSPRRSRPRRKSRPNTVPQKVKPPAPPGAPGKVSRQFRAI
jgi:hypothetical protein